MGRYYNGDIEGKFWFGIQPSNDADYFGVTGEEPSAELYYYFDKDNLPTIKQGIKECKEELGKYLKLINDFFKTAETWTDEELAKELKVKVITARELVTVYARLELGKKILKCIKKTGECEFTAEL